MVLTKRKANWSDTDINALQSNPNTEHERNKLNEVTEGLGKELKATREKSKQV
jgi:hypothetical protein